MDKEKFDKIKEALRMYSNAIDINFNNIKFGIISHPIIDSIVIPTKDNDIGIVLLNKDNYKKYLDERFKLIIDNSKDLDSLFARINKPYRVDFLELISSMLNDEELTEILDWTWTATEFPCQNGVANLNRLFKRFDKFQVMDKLDKKQYDELPKIITIYRGLQDKKARIRGLSWTISLEQARWFANRWDKKGDVYEAKIEKCDIYHYTNSRNEKEIIVNPYRLFDITKL